jgi:hypothetical protein
MPYEYSMPSLWGDLLYVTGLSQLLWNSKVQNQHTWYNSGYYLGLAAPGTFFLQLCLHLQ